MEEYKHYWTSKGISLVAMQSLLFGHPELTIFESEEARQKTIHYLSRMIELASMLNIAVVVFGSPLNRKRNNLENDIVNKTAIEFFNKLGEIGQLNNVYVGIEAIPKQYGCDFINYTKEAVDLVKLVNHPFFKVHLDAGTIGVNNENFQEAIRLAFSNLKHFHLSEKNFEPLQDSGIIDHEKVAKTLCSLNYNKWVSIEMKSNGKDNKERIEQSLSVASRYYSECV